MFLGTTLKWVNGDVYYDTLSKNLVMVSGQDAIGQAVEQVILTQVGSNRMHPDFGTDLEYIISLKDPTTALRNRIKELQTEMNFTLISFEVGDVSARNIGVTLNLKYNG